MGTVLPLHRKSARNSKAPVLFSAPVQQRPRHLYQTSAGAGRQAGRTACSALWPAAPGLVWCGLAQSTAFVEKGLMVSPIRRLLPPLYYRARGRFCPPPATHRTASHRRRLADGPQSMFEFPATNEKTARRILEHIKKSDTDSMCRQALKKSRSRCCSRRP